MAQLPDMIPQQQFTALSIRTGPEEKELIEVEDLVRVAQILKRQERGDYETRLEEIAKSGQGQLERLGAELENKFLEVSKDGKRRVQQKLREKTKLKERLAAAESFMDQHKEQIKKVTELKWKQEEVRNAGWSVLRELTQKTQKLEELERKLVIVQRQILYKTESELSERHGEPNARALQDLWGFMKRYGKSAACSCEATGQWDKLEEALKRKDEEIASLYQRFHAQQKEMEEELAALEGKLHRQLKEQEERHQKKSSEKEEVFEKNVRESKERFKRELSQAEEHFRRELSEKHKCFRKELSKRQEQFRKELLEKEKGREKMIFAIASKEVAERDKKFEKELLDRQDKFREEVFQKEKSVKTKVLESVEKELSEREDGFRKELSEIEENFKKKVSERKNSFLTEVSELEDNCKKKLSEWNSSFMQELSKREEAFKKEISQNRERIDEPEIREPRPERSSKDREPQPEEGLELHRPGTQQIQTKRSHRFLTLTDLKSDDRS